MTPDRTSIFTERHILGTIIRDSLPFPQELIPSDFSEPLNQEVASAIIAINDDGKLHDELTVSSILRDKKAKAQGHYVSELVSEVGHSQFNPAWAEDVRRMASLRRIAITTAKASELAKDPAATPASILAYLDGTLKSTLTEADKRTKPDDAQLMPLETLESFDRKNDPNCVIGSRWLCKGGSCLLISQSGIGKSSFSLQFMISLCLHKDFFGIRSKKPLRVLFIQAENDTGDVAEAFQDITNGMNLHIPERQALAENLYIYRLKRVTGKAFLDEMRKLILRHAADVVLIDPLMAFAGIDVADQQEMTAFCREGLDAVLTDTGAVLFAVHHTTKPRAAKDKEGQTAADLAYAGAGSAELVNYFREVAVLQRCPGEEPIFKFTLTKRRGRADLRDDLGDFAGEIHVRHSPLRGVIRWERSSAPSSSEEDSDSRPKKGSPRRF